MQLAGDGDRRHGAMSRLVQRSAIRSTLAEPRGLTGVEGASGEPTTGRERRSSCARSVATRLPTRSSYACIRESHSESRSLPPVTAATPRRPSRTASSRPTARSAGFGASAPFRPWLLRIVANEAKNRRRAAGRRAALALQAAATSGDAAPSPEAAAVADERRAQLLDGLARLDERDRDVLVHRFLLELGEEETAAALGVRRGTVKSRTSRALARLRELVGEEARRDAARARARRPRRDRSTGPRSRTSSRP